MSNTIEINLPKFKHNFQTELLKIYDESVVERIMVFAIASLEKSVDKPHLPLLTIDEFIDAACMAMDTAFSYIKRRVRERELLYKRYSVIWFLRNKYHLGVVEIGDIFKLHHSTIINSCVKANELLETKDNNFASYFTKVEGVYL